MTSSIARPLDATLSVTKAARLLGVHANTVRAWSDQGRLRYYRINPRGDRRYRLGDLQRFLEMAETAARGGAATSDKTASEPPGGPEPGMRPPLRLLTDETIASPERLISPAVPQLLRAAGADLAAPSKSERRAADLQTIAGLAAITAGASDLDSMLSEAVSLLRSRHGYGLVAVWERRGTTLVPRASDGNGMRPLVELPAAFGILGRAIGAGSPQRAGSRELADRILIRNDVGAEIAAPIPGDREPWGVLLAGAETSRELGDEDLDLIGAAAAQLAVAFSSARVLAGVSRQLHQADALRRVAADISSKLDLTEILSGLVDHAMVLFEADRAGVFLLKPGGRVVPEIARGLSAAYLSALPDVPSRSIGAAALEAGRPLVAVGYRDDPRGASLRSAVIQEGYDTICAAPLADAGGTLGLLNLYHDRPRPWTDEELETLAALATQASVAIRTAQNYSQMATWAAQLQSIQQLGTRLARLSSVREIGMTIAIELHQLIDYHNVRVYRIVDGHKLMPVAMKGQVGEYVDETVEQLQTEVGEGLTGWVAANGVALNVVDAAMDPRAATIPGTEADLDESMLLAPMLYEDNVLGVLVLSKLGLNQFTDDDLRLLVIYASFAAQAMANADVAERLRAKSAALERQLQSQRDLLQITESILTTLDPRAVLDQITDKLVGLVRHDNIGIEIWDRALGQLRPLTARGVHADEYSAEAQPGEQGLATWVMEHGEPQLVVDELADPRVRPFEAIGPVAGSLIDVPLRGREGIIGVLSLERLGSSQPFNEDEFELVKLFAAQVSIALQNAEVHRAVEIRAQTDDLTGLLNVGTFHDRMSQRVAEAQPFSLIMLDLDDFKRVNDVAGHQAGDELLRRIARAIIGAGRDSDSVFRYGGDEFAILLPNTDTPGARHVAERVRQALHGVVLPDGAEQADIMVSASIGVAAFPVDGPTAPAVLLAADRACYVAKRKGRDRIALAAEGAVLAGQTELQAPTPVDPPTIGVERP